MLRSHPFTAIVRHDLLVHGSYIPVVIKMPATHKEVCGAYKGGIIK